MVYFSAFSSVGASVASCSCSAAASASAGAAMPSALATMASTSTPSRMCCLTCGFSPLATSACSFASCTRISFPLGLSATAEVARDSSPRSSATSAWEASLRGVLPALSAYAEKESNAAVSPMIAEDCRETLQECALPIGSLPTLLRALVPALTTSLYFFCGYSAMAIVVNTSAPFKSPCSRARTAIAWVSWCRPAWRRAARVRRYVPLLMG
mmetsp:Transcript_697/g.2473  ORF Transcript_697/g.2473 Transcript_697/m.2473 type:complete len:212 (-) Transcript_697:666-1301(-)